MLLENDELLPELSKGRRIDGWREGLVAFAPTYKYRPNSDESCDAAATGSPTTGRRGRCSTPCARLRKV